jgi:hypothetical protein
MQTWTDAVGDDHGRWVMVPCQVRGEHAGGQPMHQQQWLVEMGLLMWWHSLADEPGN